MRTHNFWVIQPLSGVAFQSPAIKGETILSGQWHCANYKETKHRNGRYIVPKS
jgi:hypothetical protein